jgi:hypothetical protein
MLQQTKGLVSYIADTKSLRKAAELSEQRIIDPDRTALANLKLRRSNNPYM